MSKYGIDINLSNENDSRSKIIKAIKSNSVVLEFGSANGSTTAYLKNELHCNVYIIELNEEDFKSAMHFAEAGFCGDAGKLEWVDAFAHISFDYILFADVLEHLYDPLTVLKNAVSLLKENGRVLVSVPNIAHSSIIINLLKNKFEYNETGLLDETHIRFFSYYSLLDLLDSASLSVILEDAVCVDANNTEYKNDYDATLANIEALKNKQFSNVYQFVFEAVKKDYQEKMQFKIEKKISTSSDLVSNASTSHAVIYFDQGDGFNEANTKHYHLNGDLFHQEVELPPMTSRIRFDPQESKENAFCVVKQLEIYSDRGALEYTNLNGVTLGNYNIFLTKDPQMLISVPQNATFVRIEARIINEKNPLLFSLMSQLENFLKESNKNIQNIEENKDKIESLTQEKMHLISELNTLFSSKNDLENSINDLKQQNAQLASSNTELNELNGASLLEVSRLKESNRIFQFKISRLESEIATESRIVEKQTHAIFEFENNYFSKDSLITELANQLDYAKFQLSNREKEYNALIGSRSWMMTKPYRVLGRFLSKLMTSQLNTNVPQTPPSMIENEQANSVSEIIFPNSGVVPYEFASSKTKNNDLLSNYPMSTYDSEYQDNIDFSKYQSDIKAIALYLPQFHQIPENDKWWGEGFTEWSNTKKAKQKFRGHYQPRVPHQDFGYYALDDIRVMEKQAKLARQHGIYGFCFYHYWFSGKRLLEKPVDLLLKNPHIDINFCLCWANENWSRTWDGASQDILMEQEYNYDDPDSYIDDIKPYLDDVRYIRVDGKPVILVYNASEIKHTAWVFEKWRMRAREIGIGEILIWACEVFLRTAEYLNLTDMVDAAVEFPPHSVWFPEEAQVNGFGESYYNATVWDYKKIVEMMKHKIQETLNNDVPVDCDEKSISPLAHYKTAMLAWDNSARRREGWACFSNNYSLKSFYDWCHSIANYTKKSFESDHRFMFINAWNEWAEGTYLEPEEKYGYANVNTFSKALFDLPFYENGLNGRKVSPYKDRRIIYVSHDALLHGAQLLSLNIIRQLCEVFRYDVYVIVKSGGDLLDKFRVYSKDLICLDADEQPVLDLNTWIKNTGATKAICNTVVTGDILKVLSDCDVTCISLIHEMEKVIHQYSCEEKLNHIINHAKNIVFASVYVKDSVEKVGIIPDHKSVIYPQGIYNVNTNFKSKAVCHAELCEKYGLQTDCKIVVNVGYADYRKGVDLFASCAVDVCSKLSDCVFVWVGKLALDMQEKVNMIITDTPAEGRVIFTGFQNDPYLFLIAADIFLLTSREDPFPSVVLEAMNVALPVVAFEGGGGYVDIVLHDKTGILVPMEQVDALSSQVYRLLVDDNLRGALGRAANQLVNEQANFTKYVHVLLSLLDEDCKTVSVIIPNYNYAKYLPERIESVLCQTYPIYEIIILDDASTDDSLSVIKAYKSKFPLSIHLLLNDKNSGNVFSQWERGLNYASGDYIWIAEADDLAEPDFLESLMNVMEKDDEIAMAYTQSKMIDKDGVILEDNYLSYTNDIDAEKYKCDYIADGCDEIKERLSVKNTIPNVSAVVFKNNKCFADILSDARQYKVAGDWRFYVDVLKSGGKLFFCADSLNHHRRHDKGVTNTLDAERHFGEICECQQYVADNWFDGVLQASALRYREVVKSYLLGD